MAADDSVIESLVSLAGQGDAVARARLVTLGRHWLRSQVAGRLDRRLARRLGDSDLIQDVLLRAERRLDGYLSDPAVPYLVWLRSQVEAQLADTYRWHMGAQRRSVLREQAGGRSLPTSSSDQTRWLADSQPTASQCALRAESIDLARAALERLAESDRVVLVLHFLEQIEIVRIGELLGLTESGVRSRLLRALQRLRRSLQDAP